MDKNMPYEKMSILQRLAEYGLLGYVWILIISVWGGTVRYISDIKRGNKPSFISWLSEACISGFVGIITAMLCSHYNLDFLLTSAITGIAAHNGTRTLFVLAEILKKNSNIQIESTKLTSESTLRSKQDESSNNDNA